MKIVDNFLPEWNIEQLERLVFKDPYFTWAYSPLVVEEESDKRNFQFVHEFYKNDKVISDYYPVIEEFVISRLPVRSLIRIKCNFTMYQPRPYKSHFHVDNDFLGATTSIIYLNSNNGYTEFEDSEKVISERGRMVYFPSTLKHRAVGTSDKKIRLVLNINYF